MKKIMSFKEIDLLASNLSRFVGKGDVVALIGDLGTGKTTFTQKFAKALGVSENLKSPTFNYVLEYFSGRLPLYHFDVYRLSEAEEIYEVGYEDYLNSEGVLMIEWANIIESELPKEYIEINFEYNDEDSRQVEIKYIGNEKKEKEMLSYVNFGD
ncbi:MAG: tRNA (adenosine(37)-N6)-threonylcarbamoyltransferase complex ATPase subunit type 1 TsaE [Fusobacterium sp. JB021]|nr:tRNA (adenosine(37)-N6)-threonylcarbamoyltransferase complex ATPase subunit type 1 TsaE [Fusobacterium sp. JB020]MDP0493152.1 tRNA (adenosine(37)-N6)-threonylcarbamoyltransferase complex ATPase subunit type 1 TsaE [Fusobacterium sp. JB021]MDP0507549.1 tRNA (adenosine(37)-N6)-threonylcarbamoyltransferase complex ATPase subunit type 1 TsaE [Fusobacterium sp. JB019]